jgi:hypothetical protein
MKKAVIALTAKISIPTVLLIVNRTVKYAKGEKMH